MTWLRDENRRVWRWVDENGEVVVEVNPETLKLLPLEDQVSWVGRIRAGMDPVAAGSWPATPSCDSA